MTKRVIGLEFTDQAVYLVEVKNECKQVQIQCMDVLNIPSDVIVAGEIKDLFLLQEIVLPWLKNNLSHRQIPVMIGVSGLQACIRKLTIPLVPIKELDQIVRWEGENILPYNIMEAMYSYQLLSQSSTEYRVLFVALHKDRLNPYIQLVTDLHLPVEWLTLQPFGLVNYIEYVEPIAHYSGVLARICSTNIDLIVLLDGEIELVRTVPFGFSSTCEKNMVDFLISELLSTLEHLYLTKNQWLKHGIFFGTQDWLIKIRSEMPSFHWRHVPLLNANVHSDKHHLALSYEFVCAFGLSLLGVKR